MLRVAVIGCGKIADSHAEQIVRIGDVEIVGVCDKEILMAEQLGDRFSVSGRYSDPGAMIESVQPDVIHITTPPQTHLELALYCMRAGAHVYIEKPFTVNLREAETLIDAATALSRKVTVGHDAQFTPAAIRMRKLVGDGFLGGAPIHIESYYCYDLSDVTYARAMLADSEHWVRSLPGKLLQNLISHGISKIAEYLPGDTPKIVACGYQSPVIRSLAGGEIVDELRVVLKDQSGVSGYFTFSSQMRPQLHHVRLYGAKNSLFVDHDNQTVIRVRGSRYKSYLDKFIPPISMARGYIGNCVHNMNLFVHNNFNMKEGMYKLMTEFYGSIRNDSTPPIPYREILLTTRIMDEIFSQIGTAV